MVAITSAILQTNQINFKFMTHFKLLPLMLLFIASFFTTSCSNNDDEPDLSIPSTQTLLVGESFNLGFEGAWTSSDEFVASVDNNGIIKANHVGKCTISYGKNSCLVKVDATSNFMEEPLCEWGMNKSTVISICGKNYQTNGNSIAYSTGVSKTPLIMYSFTNDKLIGSAIAVSTNYIESAIIFLKERYKYLGIDDGTYYFINGSTLEKSTTAISLSLLNSNYWSIVYIPSNDSRSTVNYDECIMNVYKFMSYN